MLCELTHRINNEFSVAIGLLARAAFRTSNPDVRYALNDVQSRLHAFARAHHMLTVPDFQTRIDAHAYLRELCDAIWRAKLERSDIGIHLRSDPIMMGSEQCWKLALIVSDEGDSQSESPSGRGLRIVRAITQERGGIFSQEYPGRGTASTLVFSLGASGCGVCSPYL